MKYPRILPCGDAALTVEFGDTIDAAVNERVMALDRRLRASDLAIIETVPTYRSLYVEYDVMVVTFAELHCEILALCQNLDGPVFCGTHWEIPVVYGEQFGIDLEAVASGRGLSADEVVRRHTAPLYRVFMVGFVPGFTYLGGLDATLATPRLASPRKATPAGSISIGGVQAAVASIAAPSGWHLLGRTPVRAFVAGRNPACILQPGDHVTFRAIPQCDWLELAISAQRGEIVAQRLS